MSWYLERCRRTDIRVIPLYDRSYSPEDGDVVVLEPARRFFETQRYFDVLEHSSISRADVRTGPAVTSSVYVFDRARVRQPAGPQLAANRVVQSEVNPPGAGGARDIVELHRMR